MSRYVKYKPDGTIISITNTFIQGSTVPIPHEVDITKLNDYKITNDSEFVKEGNIQNEYGFVPRESNQTKKVVLTEKQSESEKDEATRLLDDDNPIASKYPHLFSRFKNIPHMMAYAKMITNTN